MKLERILKDLAWQSAGHFKNVENGAETLDELKKLHHTLRQISQWKALLLSGKIETGIKLKINDALLAQKVSGLTLSIFQLLTEYQLVSKMENFIHQLEKAFKIRMNVAAVHLSYPPALSEAELAQMKKALTRQIQKSIVWYEKPDDQLIGGVKIKVENQLYDATVNHQLATLRRLMESN
jgi:F-type H+-transporting ATPase subunit delta